MVNIARWTMAHRRTVVVAWIVAVVGIFAVSSSVGKKTASSFTLPGHGLAAGRRPAAEPASPPRPATPTRSCSTRKTGTLTDAADRAAIEATLARVARLPHVTSVVSPYAAGQHAISRDGTIGFATVNFDERANALPERGGRPRDLDRRIGALGDARRPARRPGDRAGAAGLARIRDGRRDRRRDRDPADQLRIVQRDGSSDRHRAARPRGRDRGDHARQPRDRHAELRLRAGADDRARRRRRLRAVHRHALPRELPEQRRRRGAGGRGGDQHLGPRRPVRRASRS